MIGIRRWQNPLAAFGKIWLPVLLVCAFHISCSDDAPPLRVDLSVREEVNVRIDPQAVTFAYLPQFSHTVSFQRYNPLIRYLEGATGRPFRQVFPDTFDEHMRMVGQGKIDISFSNPFVYVKIAGQYGAKAFARVVEADGNEFFRGEIICRSDNRTVRDLDDVRGKRWIAVDPGSAGGYLFPLGHFLRNGIRPGHFTEIAFAPGPGGKQEKVVLAVHAGQFDIGTIREGTLQVVADKIDLSEIRVISRTPWYPGWVFSAGTRLDPNFVAVVRDAFTTLDPADAGDREILDAARIIRIIPAADADFDPVRSLLSEVGITSESAGVFGDEEALEGVD
ncbi:MAG: phosphate/phosphite/phosphonate ABC transporter substrate-binding protein [Desulfobacterales bacterium]